MKFANKQTTEKLLLDIKNMSEKEFADEHIDAVINGIKDINPNKAATENIISVLADAVQRSMRNESRMYNILRCLESLDTFYLEAISAHQSMMKTLLMLISLWATMQVPSYRCYSLVISVIQSVLQGSDSLTAFLKVKNLI